MAGGAGRDQEKKKRHDIRRFASKMTRHPGYPVKTWVYIDVLPECIPECILEVVTSVFDGTGAKMIGPPRRIFLKHFLLQDADSGAEINRSCANRLSLPASKRRRATGGNCLCTGVIKIRLAARAAPIDK